MTRLARSRNAALCKYFPLRSTNISKGTIEHESNFFEDSPVAKPKPERERVAKCDGITNNDLRMLALESRPADNAWARDLQGVSGLRGAEAV